MEFYSALHLWPHRRLAMPSHLGLPRACAHPEASGLPMRLEGILRGRYIPRGAGQRLASWQSVGSPVGPCPGPLGARLGLDQRSESFGAGGSASLPMEVVTSTKRCFRWQPREDALDSNRGKRRGPRQLF